MIFFLCNRDPDRWMDVSKIEHRFGRPGGSTEEMLKSLPIDPILVELSRRWEEAAKERPRFVQEGDRGAGPAGNGGPSG